MACTQPALCLRQEFPDAARGPQGTFDTDVTLQMGEDPGDGTTRVCGKGGSVFLPQVLRSVTLLSSSPANSSS